MFMCCRYWWLYGVNFITYLTSNHRIRAAYRKAVQDAWSLVVGKKRITQAMDSSSSNESRQEMRDIANENSSLRRDFPVQIREYEQNE